MMMTTMRMTTTTTTTTMMMPFLTKIAQERSSRMQLITLWMQCQRYSDTLRTAIARMMTTAADKDREDGDVALANNHALAVTSFREQQNSDSNDLYHTVSVDKFVVPSAS